MKCEVHNINPSEPYCERQARWSLDGGYLVCGTHKRELEKIGIGVVYDKREWKPWPPSKS